MITHKRKSARDLGGGEKDGCQIRTPSPEQLKNWFTVKYFFGPPQLCYFGFGVKRKTP